ncbi:structural protein [Synechococcus phage S-SZBM1]|uniref:Structural protein n=1 Tax=Synechococcus phage S-SZBM1 TaxID=2926475 RepID=A0AC61TSW4_9CAUD|nr:hydrolase [Synechococcus phage S-SZBM1]UNH61317.1 structural protein [Synechococcus phage S-SZBM1]
MANRIQLRRDGAQQWANVNPILAQGELGIELDTSRIKIGDGVTPWNSLKYARPLETESNTANTLVKRDADGNFEAGAITATLIGNAATATRLANARSFTLTGDMTGSASFDGSANINITAELNYVPGLPHYDPNNLNATGTYRQLTIDSRGRIITGTNPTTLAGYGITDGQGLSAELTAVDSVTSIGILTRTGTASYTTRSITGAPGRIVMSNQSGQLQNPLIDLADTPVSVGSYNPTGSVILDEPQISVPETASIHETVNTTEFSVDRYGRLTYAATAPIATATQGTEAPEWNNTTTYSRYDKVVNSASRLYEAILDISAGGSEPTHTDTSDTGSWRYLGSALSPQKGLASFNQEDFDVTVWDSVSGYQGGFVSIAAAGVDNWQLQNNRISFADGNSKEDFELDQELTPITGYRGFNYLNYVKINDTSGNLLVGANNTGDGGSGELDVNVRTYFSDPDITFDGGNQIIDKPTDGNFTFSTTQNSVSERQFNIYATNSGSGNAVINILADNDITIAATNTNSRVNVEDFHFQDNVLSTTNSTLVLDPADDDGATGLVQIRGDLQVDGTTTTVNSVTMTVQDPIITLGGEDTLTSDDNKDRGVEFRYYDTQERFGFFGWDEDYSNSNMWSGTGGYRFLYNATNTNEVFAGTDAPIIAGNLRLTTNTGSTSTTTGTLVVTGGAGISENLYIGGTVDIANDFDINVGRFTVASSTGNTYIMGTLQVDQNVTLGNASTDILTVNSDSTFEDDVRISGPNTVFTINNGTTTKFEVDTDTGNTEIQGTVHIVSSVDIDSTLNVDQDVTFNATLDVDGNSTFHNNITLDTTGKTFKITNGVTDNFTVASTNGNTYIRGTLDVTGNVALTNNLTVNGSQITLGNAATDILTVNSDATFTDNLTVNQAVDFDTTLNVDGAVDFNSTLVVDGQTTIYDSLILQSDNEVLNINNSLGQTWFSVDFDNGNTVVGRPGTGTASIGTFTVHGDGTFNRDVTINGNTTIGNADTDTLTVQATSTFNANVTLAAGKDLHVGGDVEIDGDLTVHGTTTTVNSTVVTLDDPIITLGGDTDPTSDDNKDRGVEFRYYDGIARRGFYGWDDSAQRYAFYHNATNASEVFSGSRSGIDAGSLKLFDTTDATSPTTGTLIVGGGAGIGLDLRVGSDLIVSSTGYFGSNLDVIGDFDLTSDFRINTNKFTVQATTGNTGIAGTLRVDGNATIGNAGTDAHVVTGTVTFNNPITSTDITADAIKIGVDGSSEISTTSGFLILDSAGGTVNITDNADIDGNLNVDGNTQIDGTLTVDGNVTLGNAGTDVHVVTGTVTFNQAITSTDITADAIKIGVDGASEISTTSGNLILDSAGGTVSVTDNMSVTGNFTTNGNATIGNAGTDTHTVNGTVTFNQAITSTDITADNIKIGVDGSSEISTSLGNLILDSATGITVIDDTLNVNSASNLSGQLTVTNSILLNAANQTLRVRSNLVDWFTVDSDNGNTFIGGTLNVNGASVIDDTLNVTGNVDFDSDATIGGIVRIDDTTNVTNLPALFVPGGALRVAGGASFAGNVAFGSDIQIYGDFTVDGNVVQKGNQEFRGTVEFSKNSTPTSLSSGGAVQVTDGGITVTETSFFGQDLHLGPNLASTISLFGATGNASFNGGLSVTGASTFSTISASSITTSASATIGGSILVNTNKFIVAGATGNTTIAGTLGVTGNTDFGGTLHVVNAADFDSTVNIDGATTLNAALTQNSTSLFKDNFVLQGASKTLQLKNGSGTVRVEMQSTTGNITAAGLTTTNSLAVTTSATVGGSLGVTGGITGDLTGNVTGTATRSDLVGITETASSNLTYYIPFVSTTTGYTEIRTDSTNLQYNPFTNRLTVSNFRSTTDFEVQGNLNITGNITYAQSQVGDISNHTTDALAEGTTNLYHTTARARASISATGSISYNQTTGVISYTAPTLATVATTGSYNDLINKPVYATVATTGSYNDLINKPALATVATSGSYTDLINRPTISTFGASLIDDVSASAARTTLGLGSAATTSSTDYATAAQGATADDTNSDLSSLYSALVAIGNDAGITTVAQLKAALAALTRP